MRKGIYLVLLVVFCISCHKNDEEPDPSAAVLVFPEKSSACTTGIINGTKSTVHFEWSISSYTTSYELVIRNLETNEIITQTTTQASADVSLTLNTPFSWAVISKSQSTANVAKSEIWKFYNSGPGKTSYTPFPAEIVAPIMGQVLPTVMKITLDWNGSDADNDIKNYDVYFGTSATPPLLSATLTESILNDVTVVSNTIYYWKVISRDVQGNASDSGIYQFKVN